MKEIINGEIVLTEMEWYKKRKKKKTREKEREREREREMGGMQKENLKKNMFYQFVNIVMIQ